MVPDSLMVTGGLGKRSELSFADAGWVRLSRSLGGGYFLAMYLVGFALKAFMQGLLQGDNAS